MLTAALKVLQADAAGTLPKASTDPEDQATQMERLRRKVNADAAAKKTTERVQPVADDHHDGFNKATPTVVRAPGEVPRRPLIVSPEYFKVQKDANTP